MNARKAALALAATVLALLIAPATPAMAATPAAAWSIHSFASPTVFSAAQNHECSEQVGGTDIVQNCDLYVVSAMNSGAVSTDGSQMTLSDSLPAGLTLKKIVFTTLPNAAPLPPSDCENPSPQLVRCRASNTLAPDEGLRMAIYMTTKASLSGELENLAEVSGGGAGIAGTSSTNPVNAAAPSFGVLGFESPLDAADGAAESQAGAHPYEQNTTIDLANLFRTPPDQNLPGAPPFQTSVEDLRDVVVDLPPGLAGSATSAPRCPLSQLTAAEACPKADIVGHIHTEPEYSPSFVNSPLYNITPERGAVAEFGYVDVLKTTHVLYASVVPSPGGYVVRVTAHETPQINLANIITNFYGDPAERDGEGEDSPTFTNPTDCDGEPLVTSVHADSWQSPGSWRPDGEPELNDPAWSAASFESPPVSGCNQLAGLFQPSLEAHPSTTRGDSPTGLDVALRVPREEKPDTLAAPPLRKAVVTLPAGMSVNPSSANGLQGCALAQIGVSATGQPNGEAPRCPDASKIGTVELVSPALPGTLEGQVYVAKQRENPFGSLLALYIVIDDPATGVVVKLPGEVRANEATGQLETVVDNSPQFPFTELRTHFFGGQRAALRTPSVCGKYTVTSTLTPWSAPESGPPATPSGSFEITQGCAPSAAQEPNAPSFSAGTLTPSAGLFSPFVLHLHREDGSQELKGLNATLPEGLVAKLAGVGECPEANIALARSREHEGGGAEELASPSCPASSEVGTVTVGAGAGLTPFYTTGHVYLTGPYKGAPLGLAIVTPAVAGAYDLGAVVVRTALRLDPETARVTAVSDEIPHILHGIPLDVRSIDLQMARPGFTLNPTSCERKAVTGEAVTLLGQIAALSNPFQVGECRRLGFAPKLTIHLSGSTKRAGTPALRATLTYPGKGAYANVASASVALPHSEFLDNAHIKTICTRVQFAEGAVPGERCPPGSIYGHAKAITPLLAQPLEGPVYLRSSSHELPDLVAALGGQIDVVLDGTIDSVGGGIRNRFEAVPDAPVSSFTLTMQGGKKGLLENSTNLCKGTNRAKAKFTAQNGEVASFSPVVTNSCKGTAKKGGGGHHHEHRHAGG